MARRRSGRRRAKRVYRRDTRGRFASTGSAASDDDRRKRRRRAAVTGSAVAVGAVAGSQVRPTSRTRTAAQRRRIVSRHVERARADHERLTSLRARAFPTTAVTGKAFDAAAARREGRKLTTGYRHQVKRTTRRRR
jgi:hypothetical protein